ncbi:MAG: hypothetical protein ACWA5R_06690 [bacterium]
MGFLDDLEQEAQQRKEAEDQAKEEYAKRQTRYRKEVEPALVKIYEHLQRLIKNLAYVKKAIHITHPINGYGDVSFTVDPDFKLNLERERWKCEISMTSIASAEKDKSPEVKVDGQRQIKVIQQQLIDLHLGGNALVSKDEFGKPQSAIFQISGKINIAAKFHANAHEGKIVMELKNMDGIGLAVRHYRAEQINDDFLDQFSRFIVGETSTLLREELPEEYRRQLQIKVKKEQMRREWEQKLAEQRQQELKSAEKDKSMMDRIAEEKGSITSRLKKSKLLARLAKLTKTE